MRVGVFVINASNCSKEGLGETEESARKQLEQVKQRAAETAEEDRQKKLDIDEKDKYVAQCLILFNLHYLVQLRSILLNCQ